MDDHTSSQCLLLLEEISTAQQDGNFTYAATLLADTVELALEHGLSTAVEQIVMRFPPALRDEERHLSYSIGLLYARTGRIQEAIKRLERARFSYTAVEPQFEQAVRCSLELARLYCSREQFATAYHHLCQHVQPWVEAGTVTDSTLCARFYLRLAEITPDIGQVRLTADYARRALHLYQAQHDLTGQYFALVRLASALIHQGANGEAAATIERAQECLVAGNFSLAAHARVLNLTAHYHWHRGELTKALEVAQRYLTLVDQEPTSNFRVYARILLANLSRDCGCFADAQQWYTATHQVITELAYDLYRPWVDAQAAWLELRQARFEQARCLLHASLQSADLGQTMSFQVMLGVLHLVDGELSVATRLFAESLAFYAQSGDELAACTLHLYLALAAKRRGDRATSAAELTQALGWLAERRLDYLPYWWHPTLLSEILAEALISNVYPDLVERIFLNHLRGDGQGALLALWHGADAQAAQRAYRLLQSLGDPIVAMVAHLHDGPAKAVVIELLRSGTLVPATYPHLEHELMTAMRRPKPNPTLIAVFGLYVSGVSREAIAERLDCSLPGVRNYITAIYEHFGVGAEGFKTRRARWSKLVAVVKELGLISHK